MSDNETPRYLLSEFLLKQNVKVSIIDLSLEQLIMDKMVILFEKIQPLQKQYLKNKYELENAKNKLLMETDFKKELNESRPTVAMKEAYIEPLLKDKVEKVNKSENELTFFKDKLKVINDLIMMNRTLLKLESELNNE